MRICLVGNFENGHVGRSLLQAAKHLKIETATADTREAFAAPRWLVRVNWHLRQHRPPLLRQFSEQVTRICLQFAPDVLLSTGGAPINAPTVRRLAAAGVRCLNFSTDDPWNTSSRSDWFFDALREYQVVFSPRTSSVAQLRELGGPLIEYLPFGYDADLYYPEQLESGDLVGRACDVLFVGGGDADRLPIIKHLLSERFDVGLYGANWERYPETRPFTRGCATPEEIRKATCAASVVLCLVRKANRDGHVMRSFEIAAAGACMLVEDTDEHRSIFGAEGECVLFFRTPEEMTTKLHCLLSNPAKRKSMGKAVHARIVDRRNSYLDRLVAMLACGTHAGGGNA